MNNADAVGKRREDSDHADRLRRLVSCPASIPGRGYHCPYRSKPTSCTLDHMDVGISTLRAELSSWIERARAGEEVVVTDRGIPVARLLPVDTAPLLDQLVQRGVLSRPGRAGRPAARGADRVHVRGSVADLVAEQRR